MSLIKTPIAYSEIRKEIVFCSSTVGMIKATHICSKTKSDILLA
jgi:hypothetical protein